MSTTPPTHSSHRYRPDIDGLRAVAVLAVVLYHAGLKQLSGGYIGVDVFFVISGYLITQFIDQRVLAGRFSVVEFYERRVRRILPALFFLLLAANLAAFFALLPQDLVKFAKSEIATVLFIPNLFFFYWGSGYFETGTKLKPLLHMWSLGVEEQFYIFFPLIMFFVSRWGRRAKMASVWLLFTFSFVLSCWEVQYSGLRDRAFYLVPFRAWELLLGSLIALGAFPLIRSEKVRNALAAAGLGAVLISAFTYSSSTAFPGFSALAPCLGAGLIIYANESGPTFAGKVLSLRPMAFAGLISYSLYLWHWPVIVYAKQFIGRPLSIPERILTVSLSFILAILSWRFVERPFRNSSATGIQRKFLFAEAAVAAVVTIVVGQSFVHLRGLPQRFPQQAIAYANAGNDWGVERDVCRAPQQIEQLAPCHFGSAKKAAPDFILWGDSHAESLAPAFDSLAKDSGTLGWVASYPACLPLLEVRRVDTAGCAEFNAAIISLIETKDIKTVVLAGRWAVPSLGLSDGELEDGRSQVLLFDSVTHTRSLLENEKVLDRGLRRVLSRLATGHRKVILVLDVPDTGVNTPGYLARSVIEGKIPNAHQDTRIAMSGYSKASSRVDDLLSHMASEFHAVSVDPKMGLCQASQCLIARGGYSLYHDSNHLTAFGALQLVEILRPFLPSMVRDSELGEALNRSAASWNAQSSRNNKF